VFEGDSGVRDGTSRRRRGAGVRVGGLRRLVERRNGSIEVRERRSPPIGGPERRLRATVPRLPDPSLRSRPIIGLQIMHGFKYHGDGKWEEGKVYNPQNGKTYSARIKLKDGKLEMRGYIGISMLGKTEEWTKAQ